MEIANHEYYVSLEVAKLLKQAGFDWGCDTFYGLDVRYKGKAIDEDKEYELKVRGKGKEIEYVDGGMVYNFYHTNKEGKDFCGYSRPSLDVAQRWLREVKKYHIYVRPYSLDDETYVTNIVITDSKWGSLQDDSKKAITFKTYEESLEAGINKCLTLLLKEE